MPTILGVLPLVAIMAAPTLPALGRGRLHPGWPAAVVATALLAAVARLASGPVAGAPVRVSIPWFPDLGLRYALTLDGLGLVFAGLITAVGVLVTVYSIGYMERSERLGRFYAYLLLFMGAMLGIVLADDLVLLYVFWELTSLMSFFLIGYHDEREAARAGATQALVVTVAGGVTMLVGLVLLAHVGGTWQVSGLVARAAAVAADPRAPAALGLILVGAFAKSAQVPLQFWLPSAMVAPTPVSTYLHAATMVWAGVYLLARLLPVLGGVALWTPALTTVGLVTLLVGAGLALVQDDLKALLAYSTVGALGMAVALVGWGTPAAVAAAMVHVVNHATFKGALFLVAGAVEHATGSRLIERLGSLRRAMPLTAAVAAAAAWSMAGLPPFGGFWSKEAAVAAFLHDAWLPAAVVVVSGAMSLAYGARFMRVFAGAAPRPGGRGGPRAARTTAVWHRAHEPTALLWGPAAALAAAGLVFGLVPWLPAGAAGAAARAVAPAAGTPAPHGLSLTAAVVTGATLVLGAGFYALAPVALRLRGALAPLSTGRLYERGYDATLAGARVLTAAYMTGRTRDYIAYILAAAALGVGATLALTGLPPALPPGALEAGPLIAVLVAAAAAAAAVRLRLLVAAILALGVAGYAISIVYLLLNAPDIAITQAVVETMSLILFLVAITALAASDAGHPARRPPADGIIALAAGVGAAVLALLVENVSDLPRIAAEFFAHAGEAGGKNVVNLVIVDFRGWDTMGEISVLAIAALGIIALAPWREAGERRARGRKGEPTAEPDLGMTSPILRTIARLASPLIVVYAVLLWATGHYGPGGGFVAGLMLAAALILRAEAFGPHLLARRWDRLMAVGLLIAAASAVAPLAVGAPLLDHILLHVGRYELASSLIFDLGVLCLVAGAVMAAVRSLVEAA
ncbi:MAG: proton-conducting transporter membrane subunit [Armatimonadota bacterium]|nr:proton-conducting transporter membrane subunit [Armatimonadota bacterium]